MNYNEIPHICNENCALHQTQNRHALWQDRRLRRRRSLLDPIGPTGIRTRDLALQVIATMISGCTCKATLLASVFRHLQRPGVVSLW